MPHKRRADRVSSGGRLGCASGENMGIHYASPGLVPGLLAASSVLMNEPRSAWRKGRPTVNSAVNSTTVRLKPKGIYRPAPQDEEVMSSSWLALLAPLAWKVMAGKHSTLGEARPADLAAAEVLDTHLLCCTGNGLCRRATSENPLYSCKISFPDTPLAYV